MAAPTGKDRVHVMPCKDPTKKVVLLSQKVVGWLGE